MRPNLIALTILTLAATAVSAKEMFFADPDQTTVKYGTTHSQSSQEREKDLKIVYLNKLMSQQQKMYDEKIAYLEIELKKSKDRLVEKSINHDKMEDYMEARLTEESTYFKKELVAKTKTLMEYQRQLEKIKPSEDMKELIRVNTQLAVELRNSADSLAFAQIQINTGDKAEAAGRKPASFGK